MDLRDLQLLVAVASTGSITRGAAEVHLSLPSASARLKVLERTIGATLFDRGRRGVAPTPAGLLMVQHAQTICRDVRRMETDMLEYAEGRGATVRLSVNTSAAATLAPAAITRFLAAHPHVRIDLVERSSRRTVREIAERRAEIGIVADTADLGRLRRHLLRPDPLVLVTAVGHPLADRSSISYAEAMEYPFVGLSQPHALSEHLEGRARPLGNQPNYRVRLPTVDTVCDAVSTDAGVAVLPRAAVRTWIDQRRIRAIALDDTWADRNLVLCYLADDELSTTARALRDQLTGKG